MGKRLTLILGGARSGKSDFAQQLAHKRGDDNVLFIATAQAFDEEMRTRIQNHRAARPAAWKTLEAPHDIARALGSNSADVILLDCATLWTSNILLANETDATQVALRELDELLAWYRVSSCELIVVSNEVGLGIVPDNELARAYRDLLGIVNKKLAACADEVFLLVAGLPVEVKSLTVQLENL
jgi:adenosylcobinamide kinase / adenosylcobinamide-phosphate guanylyltransferase